MQNIIKKILKEKDIDNLAPETRRELKRYLVQLDKKQKNTKIRTDFMTFVNHMWPDFIEGDHHRTIAE